MILFVFLSLSTSLLFSHPASSIDQSEPSCSYFKIFEQSLQEAKHSCSLCLDSEIKSKHCICIFLEFIILIFVSAECTTASLDLLKECLNGNTVDPECYKELHTVCSKDIRLIQLTEFSLSELSWCGQQGMFLWRTSQVFRNANLSRGPPLRCPGPQEPGSCWCRQTLRGW